MCSTNISRIIMQNVHIRARAMSSSFHHPVQMRRMRDQYAVVSGLADCSSIMSKRPRKGGTLYLLQFFRADVLSAEQEVV